jgi:ATP-dependent Clp protease ATP-binding subunit ClpC
MKSRTLEARNGTGGGYRCLLAIGGLGAHTLLCGETGLHVLESAGRENDKAGRVTVRVQVVPQPPEPPGSGADDVRRQALDALADGDARSRRIVRRYREMPSPLVRDTARNWRTGRLDRVLAGDFDLFE